MTAPPISGTWPPQQDHANSISTDIFMKACLRSAWGLAYAHINIHLNNICTCLQEGIIISHLLQGEQFSQHCYNLHKHSYQHNYSKNCIVILSKSKSIISAYIMEECVDTVCTLEKYLKMTPRHVGLTYLDVVLNVVMVFWWDSVYTWWQTMLDVYFTTVIYPNALCS